MTNRPTEQVLRELLYLASPDSSEQGRAQAAEAIARSGDEPLPDSELTRLANALRPPEASDHPVDLRGADLAGGNLYQVSLQGADLTGADLRRCDLTFADLSGARLLECDARDAVLDNATLIGVDLSRARLESASMQHVDLTGASLQDVCLRDADLTDARLAQTLLHSADLRNCDLSGADLSSALGMLSIDDLQGVRWSTATQWPASQPDLWYEIRDSSTAVSPGVFRVGRDYNRDHANESVTGPRAPSHV
ncbi:pentapeptide repeat-containing protein [Streptomyces cadmiisoli]|uniref:Pentapeptide repeat-containing protein n=1 Tax=Streptomyces cadmiisoli TaxID=2184053 RepID=A0A2Z4ITT3_9ACTN|nr:hypothetical protein DN051_06670 [Streptomyces cadmiisoli]